LFWFLPCLSTSLYRFFFFSSFFWFYLCGRIFTVFLLRIFVAISVRVFPFCLSALTHVEDPHLLFWKFSRLDGPSPLNNFGHLFFSSSVFVFFSATILSSRSPSLPLYFFGFLKLWAEFRAFSRSAKGILTLSPFNHCPLNFSSHPTRTVVLPSYFTYNVSSRSFAFCNNAGAPRKIFFPPRFRFYYTRVPRSDIGSIAFSDLYDSRTMAVIP